MQEFLLGKVDVEMEKFYVHEYATLVKNYLENARSFKLDVGRASSLPSRTMRQVSWFIISPNQISNMQKYWMLLELYPDLLSLCCSKKTPGKKPVFLWIQV